nr:uncharacterized protein LOC123749672 [Procambarus clarkii]
MLLMDYREMFQVLGGCWRHDPGSCSYGEDAASIDLFQDHDINSDTRHVNITFQILYEIVLGFDLNASVAPFTTLLQQALLRLKTEASSSSSSSSSRPPKLTPALLNSTSHFDV